MDVCIPSFRIMKNVQGMPIEATGGNGLHSSIDEKIHKNEMDSQNEKCVSEEDVEVVVDDEDGDAIRESGMVQTALYSHTMMYSNCLLFSADYTPEQYNKLLKKIDRYLLPLMYVSY